MEEKILMGRERVVEGWDGSGGNVSDGAFACSPTAHLLLCGPVPNRPWTITHLGVGDPALPCDCAQCRVYSGERNVTSPCPVEFTFSRGVRSDQHRSCDVN